MSRTHKNATISVLVRAESEKEYATISVRVKAESEKEFTKFCEKIGLTKSQAINVFIEKTIREQAIPFPVKLESKDIIEEQAERISKLQTALFTGNEDYIWEEDD